MILAFLLIVFVVFWVHKSPTENKDKTKNQTSFLNPAFVSDGIKMLNDVFGTFEKYKVTVWITYGTLLGYARHNGFIPWDNDIDCLAMRSSLDIIREKIARELENKGYVVKEKYSEDGQLKYFELFYNKTSDLHMDIGMCTILQLNGENYLADALESDHEKIIKNPKNYKGWIFKLNNVFPLRRGQLYNVNVNIPAKPIELLKEIYDDSVMKVAKVKKDLSVGGTDDNLTETLITTFYPAVPLDKL